MSRNFGVRGRNSDSGWHSFWHQPEDNPIWPFVVLGLAVALIVLFGIFIA